MEIDRTDYDAIRLTSRNLSRRTLRLAETNTADGRLNYLIKQARCLADIDVSGAHPPGNTLACVSALLVLEKNIDLFFKDPDAFYPVLLKKFAENVGFNFWERLMTEPPMIEYANLTAATFMRSDISLRKSVLELGAGTGALSRKIEAHAGRYLRTDRAPHFLRPSSTDTLCDFDNPLPRNGFTMICSVNAIHCAKNVATTIRYIYHSLRPGGRLLLGEGAPYTAGREPWALNLLFGLFDGWHDRGGFIGRDHWIEILRNAGFINIGYEKLTAGPYDLGGCIWADKASQ